MAQPQLDWLQREVDGVDLGFGNYLIERRMNECLNDIVIMSNYMINQLYVCVERNDNQPMFSIVRNFKV